MAMPGVTLPAVATISERAATSAMLCLIAVAAPRYLRRSMLYAIHYFAAADIVTLLLRYAITPPIILLPLYYYCH